VNGHRHTRTRAHLVDVDVLENPKHIIDLPVVVLEYRNAGVLGVAGIKLLETLRNHGGGGCASVSISQTQAIRHIKVQHRYIQDKKHVKARD
jgi:hypothetical protein